MALRENRYRYDSDDAIRLRLGLTEEEGARAMEKLLAQQVALPLSGGISVHKEVLDGVFESARAILARYHEEFPWRRAWRNRPFANSSWNRNTSATKS